MKVITGPPDFSLPSVILQAQNLRFCPIQNYAFVRSGGPTTLQPPHRQRKFKGRLDSNEITNISFIPSNQYSKLTTYTRPKTFVPPKHPNPTSTRKTRNPEGFDSFTNQSSDRFITKEAFPVLNLNRFNATNPPGEMG